MKYSLKKANFVLLILCFLVALIIAVYHCDSSTRCIDIEYSTSTDSLLFTPTRGNIKFVSCYASPVEEQIKFISDRTIILDTKAPGMVCVYISYTKGREEYLAAAQWRVTINSNETIVIEDLDNTGRIKNLQMFFK